MKLVYHHFISNAIYLLLLPLLLIASSHLRALPPNILNDLCKAIHSNLPIVVIIVVFLGFLIMFRVVNHPRAVYLVDFSCFKPSDAHKVSKETLMKQYMLSSKYTEESLAFQRRILERSGIGQASYLPESLLSNPVNPCMAMARKEAVMVIFGIVDALLEKTAVRPKDIGVLVVNCSIYSPTPSLSAILVNHYKLRGNVVCYNLSGMGCSAGLVSIDLAKKLLQVHRDSYALLLSVESMTLNGYFGNNRSMLVSNCLFRMGGAAVLLSNRAADRRHAKYQLSTTVRTHKGAHDHCYNCIQQDEDADAYRGVVLSKDLMSVAGEALKSNITTLGPLVLPFSEQLLFAAVLILRKVFKLQVKPYIPDFKMAFEHFCIHAGGRAVLDELEKNLNLSRWHMEPSRMTLYRYGNTSSSSLWYELAYAEAKGRIKKGERIWQIGLGSGFKCNSAVWRVLRHVEARMDNPWMQEINEFPVHVPEMVSLSL